MEFGLNRRYESESLSPASDRTHLHNDDANILRINSAQGRS
jgi:hypothetical protein